MQWTVVIPAKALPAAKSRLSPATPDAAAHRALVDAVRADTITAAAAAGGVARVLVVVDQPSALVGWPAGCTVLVQHRTGLNGALLDAAERGARCWPTDGVAALVGDLPALRPAELADALAAVAGSPGRAFVPDADGTGTTLLAALPGTALLPAFGAGSAARHAARALALVAGAGLRRDVDTPDDLRLAAHLGVGPATAAVLAATPAFGALGSPATGMMAR